MNALVLWYFLMVTNPNVPAVQAGPFITQPACEMARVQMHTEFAGSQVSFCYSNDTPERPVAKATPTAAPKKVAPKKEKK